MTDISKNTKLQQSCITAVMCRIFFWCGIMLFDASQKQYGGFNHFIAGKIFRWKFCYLELSITYKIRFKWVHENDDYYYDGYHNCLHFGCFRASYGT